MPRRSLVLYNKRRFSKSSPIGDEGRRQKTRWLLVSWYLLPKSDKFQFHRIIFPLHILLFACSGLVCVISCLLCKEKTTFICDMELVSTHGNNDFTPATCHRFGCYQCATATTWYQAILPPNLGFLLLPKSKMACCDMRSGYQWPFLLTWFHFNPSTDK